MEQEHWIGIQFNFDSKKGLKKTKYNEKQLNLKFEEDHITIKLSKTDLNKVTSEIRESEIVNFVVNVLEKFAKISSYTTCYTYVIDSQLDKILPSIKNKFDKNNEVNNLSPQKEKTLLHDFSVLSENFEISRQIKNDEMYKYLNCIRNKCIENNLQVDRQNFSTSIEYMDKDGWGEGINMLRMDVKFEEN